MLDVEVYPLSECGVVISPGYQLSKDFAFATQYCTIDVGSVSRMYATKVYKVFDEACIDPVQG